MSIAEQSVESLPPIVAESESATARRLEALWETEPGWLGVLGTVDHKTIGKRYLATAFCFLIVGGLEALVMRWQLSRSNQDVLPPEAYNQVFSMHGVTMIFWYASPILSGFANYLIPLMLGARDMALPRLNAFTYWSFLFSGLLLYASVLFGQAPHGGWFAYVPYTAERFSPGLGIDFYALALLFLTISTTAGAINFIVTISRLRAPGMSLSKMPLFMYSTSTISFSILLSLPALSAALIFLELQRRWGFHFFDVAQGGSPVLWQHLFWFFGHPWVYIIFLPATGMISMLLPVFARRPIVGYTYVALATVLTGVVGFAVWVHHMFAVGMSQGAMSFFSAASMTISLFSTVQIFAWIATLWRGRPVLTTSLWFALGFIATFIIGGLNGVVTAIIPFDWQLQDTYFVVSHLHYVLIGANVFPVFAGFYYWLPKMTGRLLDERLGKISFWLMFAGFNVAFFPMQNLGLLGMPRRIYTYPAGLGWDGLNLLATIGALVLSAGILVSIYNFFVSLRSGARAGDNPWNADGLEWSTSSPPAVYGSEHIPSVITRHPLWDEHEEEKDANGARVFDGGRWTLTTSTLDGGVRAVAQMPSDTLTPLLSALGLTLLFAAVLAKLLWLAVLGAVATLVVSGVWLWPEASKEKRELARVEAAVPDATVHEPLVDEREQRLGSRAMWSFIATEATLFVMLFFSYFYLGPWPTERPPHLDFALPMLAVLLASSGLLHWGESRLKRDRPRLARAALGGTLALGVCFLVLQGFEYSEHLKTLTPQSNSYGSIFYTLTAVHGLHVLLGLCMLAYVLCLPRLHRTDFAPHLAYANASRYWHFVDAVWIVIVGVVYVLPNVAR